MFQILVVPLVPILFFPAGPATISLLIVAVIVDTVEAVSIWDRPHITKECWKAVLPLRAHGDSPASIVRILWIIRSEAAFLCIEPCVVFAALMASAGMAVFYVAIDFEFDRSFCSSHFYGGLTITPLRAGLQFAHGDKTGFCQ